MESSRKNIKADTHLMFRTILGSLLSLVNASIGLLASYLLYSRFGVSARSDQYFQYLSLPLTLAGLFQAAHTYSLTPSFAKSKEQHSTSVALAVKGLTQIYFFVAVAAYAVETALLEVNNVALDSTLIAINSAQLFFLLACSVQNCWLVAERKIHLAIILGGLPNLALALTLAISPLVSLSLTFAVQALGAALAYLLGQLYLKKSGAYSHNPMAQAAAVAPSLQQAMQLIRAFPKYMITTYLFTCFPLLDPLLSRALPAGSLSLLSLFQRIYVSLGTVISAYSFLHLGTESRINPDGSLTAETRKLLLRTMSYTLLCCVAAFLVLNSSPFLAILHRTILHGSSISTDNFRKYLWLSYAGMFAMIIVTYLYRFIFLRQRFVLAMTASALSILSYISIATALSGTHGVFAMAASYSLSWMITCVYAYWMCFRPPQLRQN